MDCFIAYAPLRKRFAFVAGNDGERMSLIGRLFVILFAFLAACFVAGMIVVGAVLYPEFSDLGGGKIDQSAINVLLGFGFIFLSGFALLPALIVVLITERSRRFICVNPSSPSRAAPSARAR